MTMDVKEISIADFDYPLPDERIASHPLADRDACRLLVARPGTEPEDRVFRELPGLLPPGALLVCNDTRAINARMKFRKETGAAIEIFLLEPLDPADYERAFAATGSASWAALVGNVKRWKGGRLEKRVALPDGRVLVLHASLGEPLEGGERRVGLEWTLTDVPFATVAEAAGYIPIPPYLRRDAEDSDTDNYQTVYSRVEGSVAAPTAGLHFTPGLLSALKDNGIRRVPVTLHVGAGTFKPVKADRIGGHPMHTEVFTVGRDALVGPIEAKRSGRPVAAVGTTSVRTLETLPLLADIVASDPDAPLHPRPVEGIFPRGRRGRGRKARRASALARLEGAARADSLDGHHDRAGLPVERSGRDGYQFPPARVHAPPSGQLLPDARRRCRHARRRIYAHALDGGYRFLSYGDACLFLR